MCVSVCVLVSHRAVYSGKSQTTSRGCGKKEEKNPNIKSSHEISPEQLKWKKKGRQSCVVNIKQCFRSEFLNKF